MLLGILASGLVAILKISVGEGHYPVWTNMHEALGFYVTVFAIIIIPLRIGGITAFLTLARMATSIIFGLIAALIVFEVALPFIYQIASADITRPIHVLKPYAVVVTAAPFAIMASAKKFLVQGDAFPKLHVTTVVVSGLLIALIYGGVLGLGKERQIFWWLGPAIAVLHLWFLVLSAAGFLYFPTSPLSKIVILVLIGIAGWGLFELLSARALLPLNINAALAAFEFGVAVCLSISVALLAVKLLPGHQSTEKDNG